MVLIRLRFVYKRFNLTLELDDKSKADYKIKAKHFVKVYGQMASIMPYEVQAWEKLFWFLKFLMPKIKPKENEDLAKGILETIDLDSYRLTRVTQANCQCQYS